MKLGILVDYQVRYNYYVNVLCENQEEPELKCNGKCALMKDLKNVDQSRSQEEPTIPSFVQFDHFATEVIDNESIPNSIKLKDNFFYYINFYSFLTTNNLDHPPQLNYLYI